MSDDHVAVDAARRGRSPLIIRRDVSDDDEKAAHQRDGERFVAGGFIDYCWETNVCRRVSVTVSLTECVAHSHVVC